MVSMRKSAIGPVLHHSLGIRAIDAVMCVRQQATTERSLE